MWLTGLQCSVLRTTASYHLTMHSSQTLLWSYPRSRLDCLGLVLREFSGQHCPGSREGKAHSGEGLWLWWSTEENLFSIPPSVLSSLSLTPENTREGCRPTLIPQAVFLQPVYRLLRLFCSVAKYSLSTREVKAEESLIKQVSFLLNILETNMPKGTISHPKWGTQFSNSLSTKHFYMMYWA